MIRPKNGRGILLHRDSSGRSESAPAQYIQWARQRSQELGVTFNGTVEQIESMIQARVSSQGDIFLDYGVKGHVLERPGLNSLLAEIKKDPNVSHVFIPRRDRLARPERPEDGLRIETDIRRLGVAIVLIKEVLPPIKLGHRSKRGESLSGYLDYEEAGAFRHELADKLTRAKLLSAQKGHSAGGLPPYGFERWLIGPDGKEVRALQLYERIKMIGHYILFLPRNEKELDVVRRMMIMAKVLTPTQIATTLTLDGIPSPCKSNRRTSGAWNEKTVKNIITNQMYIAILQYGKTSSGDQARFTKDGPRQLNESDYDEYGNCRVVKNSIENLVVTPLTYAPQVPLSQFEEVQKVLSARSKNGRGTRREHGEGFNPLGGRLYDAVCGWQMYRKAYSTNNYGYVCGLYKQTDGKLCHHNALRSEQIVPFVLACIRQRVMTPNMMDKLGARVRELIEQKYGIQAIDAQRKTKEAELKQAKLNKENAGRNMALVSSPEQLKAVQAVFDELHNQVVQLESQLNVPVATERRDVEHEVTLALQRLNQLKDMITLPRSEKAADSLISMLNVRVFCRFAEATHGKRTFNKLIGGMITFGSRPAPIRTYSGPTGRIIVKGVLAKGEGSSLMADGNSNLSKNDNTDSERSMLRNANWRTPRSVGILRELGVNVC